MEISNRSSSKVESVNQWYVTIQISSNSSQKRKANIFMCDLQRENVGTFDEGIKAAEWSPDDELLAIVNGECLGDYFRNSLADSFIALKGNDLLLTLTRSFDPLSEAPLHTASFGTDAPVSVGWGAKSTQFHGSLGKTAAAQAAQNDPLLTRERLLAPVDSGRVRIRWRGDAAWFAVSSIETVPPRTVDGESAPERPIRRIRIFSRVGAELSSTSLPVASLEDSLDWIPSGELIASSQDISTEKGEEGRKQVVFFERNGLRRYEFEVREKGRIREVCWNSGSDVLAVWIEREDGQHIGQSYSLSRVSSLPGLTSQVDNSSPLPPIELLLGSQANSLAKSLELFDSSRFQMASRKVSRAQSHHEGRCREVRLKLGYFQIREEF
jgi:hypothetical protein